MDFHGKLVKVNIPHDLDAMGSLGIYFYPRIPRVNFGGHWQKVVAHFRR